MSDAGTDQSPAPIKSDGSVFGRSAEPAQSPVVAEASTSQPMTMNSRWRWAVVAVATVLVVGLLGAVFLLARPGGGTPSLVARYAPGNSVTYLELREDMPGDQHNLLAQFASHFPGFADQAAFDTKLDETLESALGRDSSGVSWTTDIKPWFGGEIASFSSTFTPNSGTPPSMTAVVSVKAGQRAAMESWLTPRLATGWTQSTYQDSTIWTGQFAQDGERLNLTWSDEALVVSARTEDLQSALDTRADRTAGLADDQFFVQNLGGLHADRLATFYLDGRAMASSLGNQIGDGAVDLALLSQAAATRVMGEFRSEGDHLAITTRTERPANADLPPLPGNHAGTLADLAPKDALIYAEVHDVGQTISWVIQRGLTELPTASGAQPIDLSSLGQLLGSPPEEFFDFIVDASVSVSGTSEKPEYGLVASVDDMAIASSRVQKITALLHMVTQFGGGVTFADETHGTTQITVITFDPPGSEGSDTSVAMSLSDGHLIIGTHDFVIAALDRTHDGSLAGRPEFQAALTAGGASNAGVAFLDIAGLRTSYEDLIPPEVRAEYDLNQQPFLEPLSNLSVVNINDNGTLVTHVFLYVK